MHHPGEPEESDVANLAACYNITSMKVGGLDLEVFRYAPTTETFEETQECEFERDSL